MPARFSAAFSISRPTTRSSSRRSPTTGRRSRRSLLAEGVDGLAGAPALDTIYRSYAWALPLLFYRSSDDKAHESRTILGPFFHDAKPGAWTDALLPLWVAWRRWAEENGHGKGGTRQLFGQNLRASVPGVRVA